MAKKSPRVEPGFVLFDITYENGARSSRRKVPASEVGGLDGDAPAEALILEQDRRIAEMSGAPRGAIKTIVRSQGT